MRKKSANYCGGHKPVVTCGGNGITPAAYWKLSQPQRKQHIMALWYRTVEGLNLNFREARILDVACGDEQYVVRHLWAEATYRLGIDMDRAAMARNQDVDGCSAGNIHAMPFSDAAFDMVVSIDTLEHSDTPAAFLHEIGRVLRPGGRMLLCTSNLLGYRALIAQIGGRPLDHLLRIITYNQVRTYDNLYRANTLKAIQTLAHESGLCVREVHYHPEVSHFFNRSRWLSMGAFLYNQVVMSLGLPQLLNYMILLLEKPQDQEH